MLCPQKKTGGSTLPPPTHTYRVNTKRHTSPPHREAAHARTEGRCHPHTEENGSHRATAQVCTTVAYRNYVAPLHGRTPRAREEALSAKLYHDGNSAFCQCRTIAMLSVVAPTVVLLLKGTTSQQIINSSLLEVAPTLLSDTMAAPGRLFTPGGLKSLEREVSMLLAYVSDEDFQKLGLVERLNNFVIRVNGNNDAQRTGTKPSPDMDQASTGAYSRGWYSVLNKAREMEPTPWIIDTVLKWLGNADHDPLDILQILATGKTDAKPDGKPSAISICLFWGTLNPTLLNPALAPIAMYTKTLGGRYLGRAVAQALTKRCLIDATLLTELAFNELYDALKGKDWGTNVDFYNKLIVPMVKQIQCDGTLEDIPVARVAAHKARPTRRPNPTQTHHAPQQNQHRNTPPAARISPTPNARLEVTNDAIGEAEGGMGGKGSAPHKRRHTDAIRKGDPVDLGQSPTHTGQKTHPTKPSTPRTGGTPRRRKQLGITHPIPHRDN